MEQRPAQRILDAEALRALAHPLRVELYNALSVYGPATASGLAERLSESTGSTSYHLRQLARHGLVREIADRGSARERWWERTPGGVSLNVSEHKKPAERAAALQVSREFGRSRAQILDDFETRAEMLEPEWMESATMSTWNVTATASELQALGEAFEAFASKYIEPLRSREPDPMARRVQVQVNAFPIVDAFAPAGESTLAPITPTASQGE